jgi:hypothetical protein
VPLKLTMPFVLVQNHYKLLNEISRKLCIQSEEFREIFMSKMGDFYFENGSTG